MPVYDENYIKVKVKEFNGVVNKNFSDNEVPKEGAHHSCIVCISIDSAMKIEKKNYPQVFLEECKCRANKKKMLKFVDVELESDSDYE